VCLRADTALFGYAWSCHRVGRSSDHSAADLAPSSTRLNYLKLFLHLCDDTPLQHRRRPSLRLLSGCERTLLRLVRRAKARGAAKTQIVKIKQQAALTIKATRGGGGRRRRHRSTLSCQASQVPQASSAPQHVRSRTPLQRLTPAAIKLKQQLEQQQQQPKGADAGAEVQQLRTVLSAPRLAPAGLSSDVLTLAATDSHDVSVISGPTKPPVQASASMAPLSLSHSRIGTSQYTRQAPKHTQGVHSMPLGDSSIRNLGRPCAR
jgi:hypothetical protein